MPTHYDELFKKYFGKDWETARAIGMAESGLNPKAISPTNDYGVMQINNGLKSYGDQIFDAESNIKIAATHYYAKRGFQPWSVFKSGTYRKYL